MKHCEYFPHALYIWLNNTVSRSSSYQERGRRSAISGQCSHMSIGHVTFEIEARLVRQQSKFNKTLILPCLPKTFLIQKGKSNSCKDDLSGTALLRRSEITHRRSPHSWHIPWPSKACSLSPSPDRGDEEERKEGRQEVWESELHASFQVQ